jgi:phage gpG-like protein
MIKIQKNTIDDALHVFEDIITGIELNREIADIALGDILNHFRDEKDSSGMSWPPLAKITIEKRRKGRGSGSPKPLQDTGQLIQSGNIDQTTNKNAIVAFNKYDAYFGINVAELQNDGGKGKILEEDGTIIDIDVPAREFAWISDEAIEEINNLAPIITKEVERKT